MISQSNASKNLGVIVAIALFLSFSSPVESKEVGAPCLKAMSIVARYFLPAGWDLPEEHPEADVDFIGISCVTDLDQVVVRYQIEPKEGKPLGFYKRGRRVIKFQMNDWAIIASYYVDLRRRLPDVPFERELFDLDAGERLDAGCIKALRKLEYRRFGYRWFERSEIRDFTCVADGAQQTVSVSYVHDEMSLIKTVLDVGKKNAIEIDSSWMRVSEAERQKQTDSDPGP